MKRSIFIGLFIFSLALNIAGVSTLIWNLRTAGKGSPALTTRSPELSASDIRRIRNAWGPRGTGNLREKRAQIQEKKAELLDIVARDPNNDKAREKALEELLALRIDVEKEALNKIRHILKALPKDERQQFINYLKSRACMGMGPGMGMGMGRGRGRGRMMMRGPKNCPRMNR